MTTTLHTQGAGRRLSPGPLRSTAQPCSCGHHHQLLENTSKHNLPSEEPAWLWRSLEEHSSTRSCPEPQYTSPYPTGASAQHQLTCRRAETGEVCRCERDRTEDWSWHLLHVAFGKQAWLEAGQLPPQSLQEATGCPRANIAHCQPGQQGERRQLLFLSI